MGEHLWLQSLWIFSLNLLKPCTTGRGHSVWQTDLLFLIQAAPIPDQFIYSDNQQDWKVEGKKLCKIRNLCESQNAHQQSRSRSSADTTKRSRCRISVRDNQLVASITPAQDHDPSALPCHFFPPPLYTHLHLHPPIPLPPHTLLPSSPHLLLLAD